MEKKTLILGASPNPARYANIAAHRLTDAGHPIVNIGNREGNVAGVPITRVQAPLNDIDTITLYLRPQRQADYYAYILDTKPKRLIFNPGTENPELKRKAEDAGIETLEACTLVLLSTDQF